MKKLAGILLAGSLVLYSFNSYAYDTETKQVNMQQLEKAVQSNSQLNDVGDQIYNQLKENYQANNQKIDEGNYTVLDLQNYTSKQYTDTMNLLSKSKNKLQNINLRGNVSPEQCESAFADVLTRSIGNIQDKQASSFKLTASMVALNISIFSSYLCSDGNSNNAVLKGSVILGPEAGWWAAGILDLIVKRASLE